LLLYNSISFIIYQILEYVEQKLYLYSFVQLIILFWSPLTASHPVIRIKTIQCTASKIIIPIHEKFNGDENMGADHNNMRRVHDGRAKIVARS
jgi:hypothetical protein